MADDITSWVAKALIDQDASTGDYAAPRTGHLVQVVKVRAAKCNALESSHELTASSRHIAHQVRTTVRSERSHMIEHITLTWPLMCKLQMRSSCEYRPQWLRAANGTE